MSHDNSYKPLVYRTLAFCDPLLESSYMTQKLDFSSTPIHIKVCFITCIIISILLIVLDLLKALVTDPDYNYDIYTIISIALYVPIFGIDFTAYKCKKLSRIRGLFFTFFIYFVIFYSSTEQFANDVRFPVITLPILLWHSIMFFFHIFYVYNWISSLVTYAIVYLEMICIVYWKYGAKLIEQNTATSIINIFYYTLSITFFVIFTVYTYRNFESKDRFSFLCKRETKFELDKWKSLLNELPEPVILAEYGG